LLKEWLLARQFEAAVASFSATSTDEADRPPTVFDWFVGHWRGLSSEGQEYLRRRLVDEEHPSLFDSHPTMAARIGAMRAFPPQGAGDDSAARTLLPNYAQLKSALHKRLLA
jgi:hypothetical protein